MTIDAGSTYLLAFMFFFEGDKLSITILNAIKENNTEWNQKKKKKSLPLIGFGNWLLLIYIFFLSQNKAKILKVIILRKTESHLK